MGSLIGPLLAEDIENTTVGVRKTTQPLQISLFKAKHSEHSKQLFGRGTVENIVQEIKSTNGSKKGS